MKKKIAVLMPSLYMGGAEKVLINMLNALDFNKVEVTLWLLESDGILINELNREVIVKHFDIKKYFPENTFFRLLKYSLKTRQISFFRVLFYNILSFVTFSRGSKELFKLKSYGLADDTDYDLLIDFKYELKEPLYLGLSSFKAKKRAVWVHGIDIKHTENDIKSYAYKKYNYAFAVSKATKDYFLGLYPEMKDKTDVFYNIQDIDGILKKSIETIDTEIIHPALVTVGRFGYEKGIDRVPECLDILLKSGYMIHWYLIGDGLERENIEVLAEEKNVSEYLHFLGEKKNPFPYVKEADIYVQPSRTEGYCTTTVEAKVLKKAIVVTDVPGMREQFIDGKTALIAKEQTPVSIAFEIKRLLDSPELKQQLIENISADEVGKNNLDKLYNLL